MPWWGYLVIGAGTIFVFSVLILIGIMLECNQVIILNKVAVRNFSLISSKNREVLNDFDDLSAFLNKKEFKSKRSFQKKIKEREEIDNIDGIYPRAQTIIEFIDDFEPLMEKIEKEESLIKSKKVREMLGKLRKETESLKGLCGRFNEHANEYNKRIKKFPITMVAMRFKFEEIKLFNLED